MNYIRKPDWALKERDATPEDLFWNRRSFLRALGVGAIASGAGLGATPSLAAQPGDPFTPKPALNPAFADAGRTITDETVNSTYNNFYEFGSHKQIHSAAENLVTDGWTLTIDGMVEKPFEIGVEDLIKEMPVEERIYRHRCVEAWSMVAPWVGFPLAALVKRAAPLGSAKYVQFETFLDKDMARGQRAHWYPWPYTEGLTIAEATNELPLIVIGAYGKVLHKQFGAPLRLHLPWKYGFKSIKSITRISFTEERPVSFWEDLQSKEYGFWANVNPAVDHPRWSQATERVLGSDDRIPTLMWNGYGEQVAGLYTGMEAEFGERLYR